MAVYDGSEEPAPTVLERVGFYVPPYMGKTPAVALMARMPALQVVQTLTAGVDDVWPYVPAGVSLSTRPACTTPAPPSSPSA